MKTRGFLLVALALGGLYLYSKLDDLPNQLPKPDQVLGQKPVLILFTKTDCPPCEQQKHAFQDPAAQKKLQDFAVSTSDDRSTAHSYGVRAYPTLVVIDPQDPKLVLGQHEGYLAPADLVQWLDSLPSLSQARQKKPKRRPWSAEAP